MKNSQTTPNRTDPLDLATLSRSERTAIAALVLMAALADGSQNDAEQRTLREIIDQLGDIDPAIFQRVVLLQTSPSEQAALLTTHDARQAAFDRVMAIIECDGSTTSQERAWVLSIAGTLNHSEQAARALSPEQIDEVVGHPTGASSHANHADSDAFSPPPLPAGAGQTPADIARKADEIIVRTSTLTAALELLPQSIATLAIIPLQTRMVYRIGRLHGYALDRGHIKEFLAAAGLGYAGQSVDGAVRGFAGRILGRGRLSRSLARQAASSGLTFASTYAMGHAAKSYYAGGRTISLDRLRELASSRIDEAKAMYERNKGTVQETARTLDVGQVYSMLRST